MSVSYAPTKLRVPVGFEHLLEALAKEVLREQPKDIIQFAADYFRRKLTLRDEGTFVSVAPTEKTTTVVSEPKQSQQVAEEVNTPSTELNSETNEAAPTDQVQSTSPAETEETEKNQKEPQSEVTDVNETKPTDESANLPVDLDVDDPELNKAASVIQANFRTYLSKKATNEEQHEAQKEPLEEGEADVSKGDDLEEPDLNNEEEQKQEEKGEEKEEEKEEEGAGAKEEEKEGEKEEVKEGEKEQEREGEKEGEAPSQVETPHVEEVPEDKTETTITHSGSQEDVVSEDKEETSSEPALTKEDSEEPQQTESHEVEEVVVKESEPPPVEDDTEKAPETSKEEEGGNGELGVTVETQEVPGSEVADSAVATVEETSETQEPVGGEEQKPTEDSKVTEEPNESEPADEPEAAA